MTLAHSTRRFRRFGRSEFGGALVELAVILPVLILFAVGVMDYGRVFFRSIIVANAARAGAEWGAFDQNANKQTDIQNFSKLEGQEISGLKVTARRVCRCGDIEVSPCPLACASGAPRVYVEVTAVDTVAMFLNYPGLPSKVPISRTATFRSNTN